jgi:hypothetical protein
MRRRLFTLVSALSLAFCVAVVAVWPRTLRTCDQITYITNGGSSFSILTGPGAVTVGFGRSSLLTPKYRSYPHESEPGWARESAAWGSSRTWSVDEPSSLVPGQNAIIKIDMVGEMNVWSPPAHGFMGVRWESATYQETPPMYVTSAAVRWCRLAVPLWLALVVFAVLPVAWVFSWFRGRSRGREGLCAVCGYDLRASSGRCPECGNVIDQLVKHSGSPTITSR